MNGMFRRCALLALLLASAGYNQAFAQAPEPGGGDGGGGFGQGGGRGGRGGGGRGGAGALFGDPAGFFEQLDANKDGSVTQAEFTTSMATIQAQFGGGRGGRGGGQGGQGGGQQFDFIQSQLDNLNERLAPTADEWSVLEPRIRAVLVAQQSANAFGGRGGRGGGRGGRGGGGGGGGQGAQNQPASVANLNNVLNSENSTPDQVAAALKSFRDARDKAQADVAAAREKLKEVVTVKQEAILVTSNILE